MEESYDKETSKYNEAMFQIQRLHECWVRANKAATSGRLYDWKWELDVIWRELYADVSKCDEPEKTTEENTNLLDKIHESKKRVELYKALDDRHRFLKKLQDEVGKGGIFDDGTSEDFE